MPHFYVRTRHQGSASEHHIGGSVHARDEREACFKFMCQAVTDLNFGTKSFMVSSHKHSRLVNVIPVRLTTGEVVTVPNVFQETEPVGGSDRGRSRSRSASAASAASGGTYGPSQGSSRGRSRSASAASAASAASGGTYRPSPSRSRSRSASVSERAPKRSRSRSSSADPGRAAKRRRSGSRSGSPDEPDERNLCVDCGVDMGPQNPRQLCGRWRCRGL